MLDSASVTRHRRGQTTELKGERSNHKGPTKTGQTSKVQQLTTVTNIQISHI